MMSEKKITEWRAYPHDNNFGISDRGEIYSRPRIDSLGRVVMGRRLSLVKRSKKRAYLAARIGRKLVNVHVAVLETFVGPRPDGFVARHLNDDPTDNRLENLEWGTVDQNASDRNRNGGYPKAQSCKRGHAFDEDNTWLTKEGWQQCRLCHRLRERERKRLSKSGGCSR